MRVRWLGQPRSVDGMMRQQGAEYDMPDDQGEELIARGFCAPVDPAPSIPPAPKRIIRSEEE